MNITFIIKVNYTYSMVRIIHHDKCMLPRNCQNAIVKIPSLKTPSYKTTSKKYDLMVNFDTQKLDYSELFDIFIIIGLFF